MENTNMPQIAEPAPESAVGVIETDAFCESCGFNLHTQKVWRDDRLGIAVTRCPECGKVSAAGMRTTSTSAWARRVALLGLIAWIFVGLTFTVASFFMFFGFDVGTVETLTRSRFESLDGSPVQQNWTGGANAATTWIKVGDQNQTVVPSDQVVYRTTLVPAIGGPKYRDDVNSYRYESALPELMLMQSAFSLATFLVGCIIGAFTWFWRRGRVAVWLLLPVLSLLFGLAIDSTERNYTYLKVGNAGETIRSSVFIASAAWQILLLGFGLYLGRPVARFVVSLIVPPKARQLFAFLWHCDGKTMPSA